MVFLGAVLNIDMQINFIFDSLSVFLCIVTLLSRAIYVWGGGGGIQHFSPCGTHYE